MYTVPVKGFGLPTKKFISHPRNVIFIETDYAPQ